MSAQNAKASAPVESPEWDLVMTRVFDAPRELVFKAWTETRHVAQWWGPKGFTNPICEMDVRAGGAIRIHMRAPNGIVYPMTGVFEEITEPERLVFVSSALDENGNSMFDVLSTVIFAERRGKTVLTLQLRVVQATAQAPQYLKGMEAGWTQSLDRLGDHLAEAVAASEIAMVAGEREIVGTHVFDAPRDLVWKMWTDRYHVAQWWGPKGFWTTVHQMDVRPGGEWRFIMHGPDGRDYHNRIIFREIKKPELLVYEHSPDKESEPVRFVTTVTLTEEGETTRVRVQMIFRTAAERDHNVKTYGAVEGLRQHFGRLAEYVEKTSAENLGSANSGEAEFAITRVFDAPRALVFKAWTEPERLAQWWGPKGCTIRVQKMDLRPGGMFLYVMRQPQGEMWGKFVYREIVPPERIVFINLFSNEKGETTRSPFHPNWPLEVLNKLLLTEHEGKTTLTLRGGPINASEEEQKIFESFRESMQEGFGGTFGQLDEHLAKAKKESQE